MTLRAMLNVLVGLVAGYAALVALLALLQRRFIYLPFGGRPNLGAADLPGVAEVQVPTEDGLELLAWHRPAAPGRPMLLYLHGNAGNLLLRADKVRPFAERGYGILLLAWRGYSGNPGRPSETGLHADGRAALQWLAARGVPPERILLYGESLGSAVAVRLATEHRFAALVLESPFTSLPAVARLHFRWLPIGLMLRDRFDSLSRIAGIRAPLIVVHGERDEIVPATMGRALLAAAPPPKQGEFVPEARHNDLIYHGLAERVLKFFYKMNL